MVLKPYSRKAYYYETDKMGIVHHANYIRWFEETRVDLLTQAGLPFEKSEEQGVYSPVLSVEVNYRLPFKFDEVFIIKAYLEEFGGTRYSVRYEVFGEDGEIHVTGRSTHCFVDIDMKPVRLKRNFPEMYNIYNEMYQAGENLFSE